jgi:hypothetical protein
MFQRYINMKFKYNIKGKDKNIKIKSEIEGCHVSKMKTRIISHPKDKTRRSRIISKGYQSQG